MASLEGFLAIFSDIAPGDEHDYVGWLTQEHAAERVGTRGFLGVRVFRTRVGALRRYLIIYALESANVLGSAAYLARLAAPSAWTQSIMPRLGKFVRGGGRRVASAGRGMGAVVAPLLLDSAPDELKGKKIAELLVAQPGIVAASVSVVDRQGTDIPTNERELRGGDSSFEALLLIEALDEESLANAVAGAGPGRCPGLFGTFFTLDARTLALRSSAEVAQ